MEYRMAKPEFNEKTGAWTTNDPNHHWHDKGVEKKILSTLAAKGIKTFVDFGCGKGTYAKAVQDSGYTVKAFDGNPNTVALTGGLGQVKLLDQPFKEGPFDFVMSLEVGEHIPKEGEQNFLNGLSSSSRKYVLLSWALPGQGGSGHVNCQPREYIIAEMAKRGFSYDEKLSKEFMESATISWFRRTLMFFEKK